MTVVIIISALTCIAMIIAVLYFPKIHIGTLELSTYWLITLLGALVLISSGSVSLSAIIQALLADTAVNPLKILILFISMTVLSIFLDELGFFRYLAGIALNRAGNSQLRLFILLYITVSVLTVFTSNDIIILSFTPFICYFAKNAHISPVPYLAAEFVAANTWSMALIIGNPTNIYLVTAAGGDFISYAKIMLLPTLASGAVACLLLFLLFRKKLLAPINAEPQIVHLSDGPLLWVGIIHLAACTVVLAIGSYVGIEMWLVSLISAVSLLCISTAITLYRKTHSHTLTACLKRAPWELIPFILSMFVLVEALNVNGVTEAIWHLMSKNTSVWEYGITSFFAANLINNIPMSVLYSSILQSTAPISAVMATVIGSNLGACLTPIGALAGIMWCSILKKHGLKFGYLDFLKIGVTVAVPALTAALAVLSLTA